MTKEQRAVVAEWKVKLKGNPRWQDRALVVLLGEQTVSEQDVERTIEHNRRGFNSADAEILTSFAKQVMAGRTLSAKQRSVAARALPKYAGQLWRLATGRAS